MSKKLVIEPKGWRCTIAECPPGLFMHEGDLVVKSAYYSTDGYCDVYFAEDGDAFWGGVSTKRDRDALMVQPCVLEWQSHDV